MQVSWALWLELAIEQGHMRNYPLGLLRLSAGQGTQRLTETWKTGLVLEGTRTSNIPDPVWDPAWALKVTQRCYQAVQVSLACRQGCVAVWGVLPCDLEPPDHAPRSQAALPHDTRGLSLVASIRLWSTLCPQSPGPGVRVHPKARRHSGRPGLPWVTHH